MGDEHELYGRWDEDGEFNPFDGEPDDDPVAEAGLRCCNCDDPVVGRGYPYLFCSDRCAEEAHTVRYARGVIRDGRILDPKVAEAVQIRIGMVLSGGYPKRERQLSDQHGAEITERDEGRCRVCGGPGDQIDHINEDLDLLRRVRNINHPANLQLICDACHRAKTLSTFQPVGPEHQAKADELYARIDSPIPLRESDDDVEWKGSWRAAGAARSALVRAARLENR